MTDPSIEQARSLLGELQPLEPAVDRLIKEYYKLYYVYGETNDVYFASIDAQNLLVNLSKFTSPENGELLDGSDAKKPHHRKYRGIAAKQLIKNTPTLGAIIETIEQDGLVSPEDIKQSKLAYSKLAEFVECHGTQLEHAWQSAQEYYRKLGIPKD